MKFLIRRSIGNFLLLLAIFGILATFGPVLYYEINFRLNQMLDVHYQVAEQTSGFGEILKQQKLKFGNVFGFGNILAGEKEPILIPIDTNFDILIPKIAANAPIFPNVDPANPSEFLPVLQKGVAHAKGTVFPGQKGTIYFFAHSTDNFWDVGRYNAVFYLLKELSPGDEIVVFFQGVRHNYQVSETKILAGSDVSLITQAQSGEEQLILQTCWPPGTTWKRFLVFAKPK